MTLAYVVQHGEKQSDPGDPGITEQGRWQADCTARLLRDSGITAVYSSPLLRAVQTAERIAQACGLDVVVDKRLRERMNWDGSQAIGEFLRDWSRTVQERDFIPPTGDSSNQAAQRFRDFLTELSRSAGESPVAVVTHGGVTVDLLRTLLGDDAVPTRLVVEGVPSAAVTTLSDLTVVSMAMTSHLENGLPRRPERR